MEILGLNSLERLEAARDMSSASSSLLTGVLVVLGVLIGVALAGTLGWVVFRYLKKRRQNFIDAAFNRKAKSAGLTHSETVLMYQLANQANLEKKENIFEISSVFDRVALVYLAETSAFDGFEAGRNLKEKLFALRNKLNFKNNVTNLSITLNSVTTTHIPLGQKLLINLPDSEKEISSKLVGYDKKSITLKVTKPVSCEAGASIFLKGDFENIVNLEFQTPLISSNGILLIAEHNADLRFRMTP